MDQPSAGHGGPGGSDLGKNRARAVKKCVAEMIVTCLLPALMVSLHVLLRGCEMCIYNLTLYADRRVDRPA